MISVAFSPDMNSVLGDVEVITDRNGRQEFVVSNFSLTTGQSTAFIRSSKKFEVTCHFSPDGNYVGRYIIKYKGDLNRAEFDHGEIEISNAMGTEIKSLLRLEQPENISFGWIKPYVNR